MAICQSCGTANPDGFKFCGNCGSPLQSVQTAPPAAPDSSAISSGPSLSPPQPSPLPELQQPVLAPEPEKRGQLFLIKGTSFTGSKFDLFVDEIKIGRIYGTLVFPNDESLSPLHATVFFRDGQFFVRDENSTNGVFVRIKKTVELGHGDTFIVGQQWIRFEAARSYRPLQEKLSDDGTKFYGSPPESDIYFRLVHFFKNNTEGAVYYAFSNSVRLGRENCDLSFPSDRHISGKHARVYEEDGRYFLQDLGSKNGTFIRINSEHPLSPGDTFFIGQQLFRFEG